MNDKDIEREISELELEASDAYNSAEVRYFSDLKAYLLRYGYRLRQEDSRIIALVHVASDKTVYRTTENELRYARMGKDGWLKIARQRYHAIAEGIAEI